MRGRIPQSFIDELLNRTDIIEVVGRRVDLKKAGREFTACCPFHNEKTPSFTVSPNKQFYHCFGCGAHGTAISFLMEHDNLEFVEAIEQLADVAGLSVPREGGDHSAGPAPADTSAPLFQALAHCAQYYKTQLSQTPTAIEYLKRRGLTGETAKTFAVGYAPEGWQNLASLRLGEEALLQTGMMIENDKGRRYDRFRERVMFPIRDPRGRCIGFGGRVLDQGEPKYLNSPETPLFNKSRSLYGLYEAKQHNRRLEQLIVVEGYMDVIALHQYGIKNAVATLGTATTGEHIQMLFRSVSDIVFAFDGDRAGRKAAWRALNNALPHCEDGRNIRFFFLPDGEDPDSFTRQHGQEAFEAALARADSLSDFFFAHLSEGSDLNNEAERARLASEAKPLIEQLPAGVYRDLMEQRLQTLIGVTVALAEPPPPAPKVPQRPLLQPRQRLQSQGMTPMRWCIAVALQFPSHFHDLTHGRLHLPTGEPGASLLMMLSTCIAQKPEVSTAALLERFRDDPHSNHLNQLAAYKPEGFEALDLETAEQYLQGSLSKLRQKAKRMAAAALPSSTRDLSEQQKEMLRKQFQRGESE